jgi:hypothetical protein
MALTSGTVSIGTVATLIDGASSSNPIHLHIHNNDNTDNLYLGDSTVTTSTGLVLTKLDSFEIHLRPGNRLYATSSKEGHIISYIKQDF